MLRDAALAASPAGGSCHVCEQDAEAAKHEGSARRERQARHELCKNSREHHDRENRQRQRAVVDEQSGQTAQHIDQRSHDSACVLGRRAIATEKLTRARPDQRRRVSHVRAYRIRDPRARLRDAIRLRDS